MPVHTVCAGAHRGQRLAVRLAVRSEDNIAINFDFVRDKRSPEEMQRFADLMRTIPGVDAYMQGLEQANWGMHRGMNPADVLGSDDALDAWKKALIAASKPA